MTLPRSRSLLALTLGLAAACGLAPAAQAGPITYSTTGSVDTPSGGVPNLIYYNGMSNVALTPGSPINLGQFQVSSLIQTTTQTYSNTPFQIFAYSGSDQGEAINGVLNGTVGPNQTGGLTASVTSITQYLNNPLPFAVNLPLNTPMTLNTDVSSGATASTTFVAPAVPEPASVLVFAVSLGGLGLYARRRRAGR